MKERRIAKFEKVTKIQFVIDWKEAFGSKYSNEQINEIYESIRLPQRATIGSAGYDFYSPIHIILEPGKTIKIPTGIRCKMDSGWFLGILPRSGHGFKYGVKLTNTLGIVDGDYYFSDNEGHIFVKLINDSSICKTVDIPSEQGMAQGIFLPFGITEDDNTTKNRNGGFGSTNK